MLRLGPVRSAPLTPRAKFVSASELTTTGYPLSYSISAVAPWPFDDGLRSLTIRVRRRSRIFGSKERTLSASFMAGITVSGVARMDRPDGHDCSLSRIDIPRHDGLKRDDKVAGDHHGVDGLVGARGMAADALMVILAVSAEAIIGPERRRMLPSGAPGWLCRPKIASKGKRSNRPSAIIAWAPLNFGLFGRLEDRRDGAEAAGAGKILGRAQQHRRMSVMAAGMHLAENLACIGQPGFFRDRKSIHVGADGDALLSSAGAETRTTP